MWEIVFLDVSCRNFDDEWWRMCAQNYECGKFRTRAYIHYEYLYVAEVVFDLLFLSLLFPKRDMLWRLTTDPTRQGGLQISFIIAMSFPFANISAYSSSKIIPVESPVTTRNSMPNSSASGRTRSSEIKSTSQPFERKRKASATKGWRSPRVPTLQKAHFMIPKLQRNQIEPKSCSGILQSTIELLPQHCRRHLVSMKIFNLPRHSRLWNQSGGLLHQLQDAFVFFKGHLCFHYLSSFEYHL